MTQARATLAVVVGLIAVFAFSTLSAGAGVPSGNMVTVNKVVVGPAPAGATFTIELVCDGGFKDGPDVTVMTFDEHGTSTSGNNVVSGIQAGSTTTCRASEAVEDRSGTTYACVATGTSATCSEGADAPVVQFVDVSGSSGVITITNSYPTAVPSPEPAPATEVVVAPAFTG
jgi:hypothetical protein